MKTTSFKDLIVWQRARDVAVAVYQATDSLPKSELYGLTSQMRRAAVSISSNIAEGYHRFQEREKRQFLVIAFGSGSELESQIEIVKVLYPTANFDGAIGPLKETMRILNTFIK